jgi:hypothetical protein
MKRAGQVGHLDLWSHQRHFSQLLSLTGLAFISVGEEKLKRVIFIMVSLAVDSLFGVVPAWRGVKRCNHWFNCSPSGWVLD